MLRDVWITMSQVYSFVLIVCTMFYSESMVYKIRILVVRMSIDWKKAHLQISQPLISNMSGMKNMVWSLQNSWYLCCVNVGVVLLW